MEQFKDKMNICRQELRRFYTAWGVYVLMAVKTAAALALLLAINRYFPGRQVLGRGLIVAAAAILCSILPWNYITFLTGLWLLGQLSAVTLEGFAFMAVLLAVLCVLRYLMLPGCAIAMALMPLLCLFRLSWVLPLTVGLLGGMSSFLSVAGGLSVYYVLEFLVRNAAYFADTEATTLVQRLLFLTEGFLNNREMQLALVAFSVTTLAVYCIGRLSMDHSRLIAALIGALLNPVILLLGTRLSETAAGAPGLPGGMLWGSLAGFAAAALADYFLRGLDYYRTEHVQFEDDDYYYYVKAVPKIKLPEKERRGKAERQAEEAGARAFRQAVQEIEREEGR